jgi:alpha-L-fucosidase
MEGSKIPGVGKHLRASGLLRAADAWRIIHCYILKNERAAVMTRTGRMIILVLVGTFIAFAAPARTSPAAAAQTAKDHQNESKEARDQRMSWWRNARFGMFIHWGLYAVPAGEYKGKRSKDTGEWIQSWANIPREEYEEFAKHFDPVKFNAADWVGSAKDAGMQYIVITSKHHEGFSMYDSKVSNYDIVDSTPFKKDPMAELSRECRRQGIHFCFYYSIMDWHHPSQYVDAPGKARTAGNGQNKILPDQKAAYIQYMKAQLKELVKQYDPDVLWFDGEWTDWWTEQDGKDLYSYVRELKPSIIVNNRVGKGRQGMQGMNKGPGYAGDFGTPEQEIPSTGLPGVDWESCMTMNDTWGFKAYDQNWKSAQTLIRNLVDITSKGGNYLLNVGPTAEGVIPEASVTRLKEIGRWMKVNSECIYGTGPSPFKSLTWGRATQRGNRVYLAVFNWPDGQLNVPPLKNKVQRAYLLADPGRNLKVEQKSDSIVIGLPTRAPDAIASVLALELDGPPAVK